MKNLEQIRIAESRLMLTHDHGKMTATWHGGEKVDMSGNQVFFAMFKEIVTLQGYVRDSYDALQHTAYAAGLPAGSDVIKDLAPAVAKLGVQRSSAEEVVNAYYERFFVVDRGLTGPIDDEIVALEKALGLEPGVGS